MVTDKAKQECGCERPVEPAPPNPLMLHFITLKRRGRKRTLQLVLVLTAGMLIGMEMSKGGRK